MIEEWADRPFSWGENDCVHFAAAVVEAFVPGSVPLADWPGYSDERQALRLLAGKGTHLRQAVSEAIGIEAINVGADSTYWPAVGDLVMAPRPVTLAGRPNRYGPGIGVVVGAYAQFVGEDGLEAVSIDECICGWPLPLG